MKLPVTRRRSAPISILGLGLVVVAPSAAQDAEGVSIEVGECLELASPAERLACFESRVEEALNDGERDGAADRDVSADRDGTTQPEVLVEREVPAERSSIDAFGLPSTKDETQPEREDMLAIIASVRELEPNRHVITLDNGQVWLQVRPDNYRVRPGFHVRIYPSRWGESYRLSAEETRGFVQVRRVQ